MPALRLAIIFRAPLDYIKYTQTFARVEDSPSLARYRERSSFRGEERAQVGGGCGWIMVVRAAFEPLFPSTSRLLSPFVLICAEKCAITLDRSNVKFTRQDEGSYAIINFTDAR